MNFEFLHTGIVFGAALWVLCASAWRLNLLKWGTSQCLQILAYLAIALWAASVLLGLDELRDAGVVGIALLFFSGSKRWLVKAPDDTARAKP